MNLILKKNLELVKTFDKGLSEKIEKSSSVAQEVITKSGEKIFTYNVGEKKITLNSKYAPTREAKVQAENFNLTNEHAVIVGGGNGFFLREILNKAQKNKRVLYVEPEPFLFFGTLSNIELEEYAEKFSFITLTYPEDPLLKDKISDFVDIVSLEKVDFIIHPITDKHFKERVSSIIKKINDEILSIVYEFTTRLKSGKSIQFQILKNITTIVSESNLSSLKNSFKNIPAVIVSAGPSLDKNIVSLKRLSRKALIISVDTALGPLLSAGIEPHIVVVGDPSYFNYLHLKFNEPKNTFLVAEPSVTPETFEKFKGRVFIANFGKPLLELIESRIGKLGSLDVWGSVATASLSLGEYVGANPIVIVGQDFSFSYGKSYARKTYYEYNMAFFRNYNDYLNSIKMGVQKELKRVTDIYSRETFTTTRLLSYRDYFLELVKKYGVEKFINSTEGGILKDIRVMPLEDTGLVFEEKDDIDFFKKLKELYKKGKKSKNKKNLLKLLNNLLSYFSEINRVSQNEIYLYERGALLGDDVGRINDFIYSKNEFAEILENYSQEPIYTFLMEQKKVKEKDKLIDSYIRYVKKIERISEDFINELKGAKKSLGESKS